VTLYDAADTKLMAAGYLLSMLTEPRRASERTELLEMVRGLIHDAMRLVRAGVSE
jgi:hypothetical protein